MKHSENTFGERSPERRPLPKADRLVIIAAPSGCGKSTFINKLRSGGCAQLCDALALGDIGSWQSVDSEFLVDMPDEHFPKLIVHYALPALPLKRGVIRHIADDAPMGMFFNADQISLVTLYTSPHNLIERIISKKRSRKANRWPVLRTLSDVLSQVEGLRSKSTLLWKTYRWEQLEELFSDPDEIKALYGHWFEYVSQFNIDSHWLVCAENEPVPQDLREWQNIVQDWQ